MRPSLTLIALFPCDYLARNPPPVCHAIPDVDVAELCIQLYNLDFANNDLSGCARFLAELEGHDIFKLNLGCFKLPTDEIRDEL